METGQVLCTCLLLCLFTGSLCMPSKRMFLNINCDSPIPCPKKAKPICCTDGHTYPSPCELEMENQRRICHEGKFNPIAKVSDGPCGATKAPEN